MTIIERPIKIDRSIFFHDDQKIVDNHEIHPYIYFNFVIFIFVIFDFCHNYVGDSHGIHYYRSDSLEPELQS